MAEKRMFAKTIIDSDTFMDMPLSTQALYFHLSMRADDDGFINNPKKIQRMIGASEDDLKVLIVKRYILPFDSGVVVIKHWKIHNAIKKDRYKPTLFIEEKSSLDVKDNGEYMERSTTGATLEPKRSQTGTKMEPLWSTSGATLEPQVREVKISLVECSGGKCSGEGNTPSPARRGKFKNVELSDEDYNALKNDFPSQYEDYIEKLSCYMAGKKKSYDNHYATIVKWITEDNSKQGKRAETPGNNIFLQIASEEGIV